MRMVGYGPFTRSWQSCFPGYRSPDPIEQQIAEISSVVGYGLRATGMVSDDKELTNIDRGDYAIVVYYEIACIWYPFVVHSVFQGEQGSLSDTVVSFLIGAQCVPTIMDLVSNGLWPTVTR